MVLTSATLIVVISIWVIHLFVGAPSCAELNCGALERASRMFSSEGDAGSFFRATLITALMAIVSAVFFASCWPRAGIVAVGVNVGIAIWFYTIALVFVIALPLFFAPRLMKNA